MYKVWTKNCDGKFSIMTAWQSRGACRRMILGRWGHWPPWAFISKAQTTESFIRANGD
uniref:Uncharacterized protein n=1 Tax=viral metagenome TaxID=1070528 RepID=A0A6M3LN19_9ZZZZ